jgi:hypothetical protein
MITLSSPSNGEHSFGSGAAQGMATGRTANFGYGALGAAKPLGKNPMSMQGGAKLTGAPFQGTPEEPIGIQPAAAGSSQKQSGGGGGGLISRGMSFLKGMGEGGGAEAAGGAAEAGGAADVVGELAPLALAAV